MHVLTISTFPNKINHIFVQLKKLNVQKRIFSMKLSPFFYSYSIKNNTKNKNSPYLILLYSFMTLPNTKLQFSTLSEYSNETCYIFSQLSSSSSLWYFLYSFDIKHTQLLRKYIFLNRLPKLSTVPTTKLNADNISLMH